jgi:hypothetical protein
MEFSNPQENFRFMKSPTGDHWNTVRPRSREFRICSHSLVYASWTGLLDRLDCTASANDGLISPIQHFPPCHTSQSPVRYVLWYCTVRWALAKWHWRFDGALASSVIVPIPFSSASSWTSLWAGKGKDSSALSQVSCQARHKLATTHLLSSLGCAHFASASRTGF